MICREGEQGESMFVIVDGLVHLLASRSPSMPEVRTRSIFDEGRLVGKLRRGDVVGTGALITGEPRSATAKAAVATDLLELGRDDFRALIGRFPRMLENLTAHPHAAAGRGHLGARRARAARGEAVALVAGPSLEGARAGRPRGRRVVEPALGASRSTPASRSPTSLDRLDAALREHGTVVVVAAIDQTTSRSVMRHVDRTVALVGTRREAEQLGALAADHGVAGPAGRGGAGSPRWS